MVTAISHRTVYEQTTVSWTDANGNIESVTTTGNHEFYVDGVGWTTAANLLDGQQLVLPSSLTVTVTSVVTTVIPEGVVVYNFTVTDGHTYFVDDGQGEVSAVWVHNINYKALAIQFAKIFPNSKLIKYGDGLSGLAKQRRLTQSVKEGRNLAVFEFVHKGVTKTKIFESFRTNKKVSIHSEVVTAAWFKEKRIDSANVTRIYSEYHPCSDCNWIVRKIFDKAKIEYSWPYKNAGDSITALGRALKKIELGELKK